MKKNTLILLLLFMANFAYAKKKNASIDTSRANVKAVLIQINNHQNKVDYFYTHYQDNKMQSVIKDVEGVKNAMHADFTDNFTFCKVYYFNDTDADKIMNKQFDGVLMTADGKLATNINISNKDTNYLILYYGYPTSQGYRTKVVKDTARITADHDSPYGKGMVINNYKFQQIGYEYNIGSDEIMVKLFYRKYKKYYYFSKLFDIDYYASAKTLQQMLENNLEHRRKKRADADNEMFNPFAKKTKSNG